MYQQGSLTHFASFSPKSYLVAAAESESAKQTQTQKYLFDI